MNQVLMSLCCACMAAAFCEQMLGGSRFFTAIRLVLGMEMAARALFAATGLWKTLNG